MSKFSCDPAGLSLEFAPQLCLGDMTYIFKIENNTFWQFLFWADLYCFRNLAHMRQNLFKEFHRIHNAQQKNRKNNFITGTSTINDDRNKKFEDFVTIRLLPHQIFVCPMVWLTSLANRRALQTEGINYYKADALRKVFFVLIQKRVYLNTVTLVWSYLENYFAKVPVLQMMQQT